MTTDYFMRWVEAILLKQVDDQEVVQFIEHNIITGFHIHIYLIFYNTT